MCIINLDIKEVLMDEKNLGIVMFMCYIFKMFEVFKKMVKGFFISVGGCMIIFVESMDIKLINEIVCNNFDVKLYFIVEMMKISDIEFVMIMKLDVDVGGNKIIFINKIK